MRFVSGIHPARPFKYSVTLFVFVFTFSYLTTTRADCTVTQDSPAQNLPGAKGDAEVPAQVSGHVYRADDDSPLVRAIVTLTSISQEGIQGRGMDRSTRTNIDGTFVFDTVLPGTFVLQATKSGFIPAYYRTDPSRPRTQIMLRPGQTLGKIDIKLIAAGIISGHVMDEDGDPAVGLKVVALRPQYQPNGSIDTSPDAEARSDDRGEYRLIDLRAGNYVVRAGGAEEDSGAARRSGAWVYLPSYYLNATRLGAAQRVKVKGGLETSAIDLRVVSASRNTYAIHGTAPGIKLENGWALSGISVILPDGSTNDDVNIGRDWKDSSFTIGDVAPGQYTIRCYAMRQKGSGLTLAPDDFLMAVGHANIIDRDVAIEMQFGKPGEIHGQVNIEKSENAPVGELSGLDVDAERDPEVRSQMDQLSQAHTDAKGGFMILGLAPGKYWLDINLSQQPFYIKQVFCSGANLTLRAIEVEIDSTFDCQVTLGTDTATITGQVTDGDKPLPGYEVIAFPEQRDVRASPYFGQDGVTNSQGQFTLSGLAPGDYLVFAILDDGEQSYYAPDFVDRNLGTAFRMTLKPSETKSINLAPITPQ